MSRATPDVTGKRFGRLTARSRHFANTSGVYWRCDCDCDCGNTRVVRLQSLLRGQTKSCGCLRRSASQERLRHQSLRRAGEKRYRPVDEVFAEAFRSAADHLAKYARRP